MSQTSNNIHVGTHSLVAPTPGEMYYDSDTGEMQLWDGSDWVILPPGYPADTSANFRIFVANDISYAKITAHSWWLDYHSEIHQWLSENNAGYYIEEFRAISFFDHKFATAFQLQWG